MGNDPTIAPLYYNIKLYPSLSGQKISEIEKNKNFDMPNLYKGFLSQANGAFVAGINLYGFPNSWLNDGLINRQQLEPLNLYIANLTWKKEMNVNQSYFLFGGSDYSDTENAYYFIHESKILSLLENGTKLNEWNSMDEMLEYEIKRLIK